MFMHAMQATHVLECEHASDRPNACALTSLHGDGLVCIGRNVRSWSRAAGPKLRSVGAAPCLLCLLHEGAAGHALLAQRPRHPLARRGGPRQHQGLGLQVLRPLRHRLHLVMCPLCLLRLSLGLGKNFLHLLHLRVCLRAVHAVHLVRLHAS